MGIVRHVPVVCLVAVALMVVLGAQEGLRTASFEAATIKRNLSGADNWALTPRPTGQFTIVNGRLASIVQAAFLVQDFQLDGLPDWTRNERYDILAKLDAALAARSLAKAARHRRRIRRIAFAAGCAPPAARSFTAGVASTSSGARCHAWSAARCWTARTSMGDSTSC